MQVVVKVKEKLLNQKYVARLLNGCVKVKFSINLKLSKAALLFSFHFIISTFCAVGVFFFQSYLNELVIIVVSSAKRVQYSIWLLSLC